MAENAKTIKLTDENFKSEVLESDDLVLVDFWAEWCGPCHAIAPAVEELASKYEGRLKVGKMNVDESPATPGRYGIRSIPTLLFLKEGEVVDNIVGAVPGHVLENKTEELLK
jgi:thioredoxin 1